MLVNQQDQKASLYAFKMLPEAVMLVNQQDQKACLYRLYDAFKFQSVATNSHACESIRFKSVCMRSTVATSNHVCKSTASNMSLCVPLLRQAVMLATSMI